MAFVEKSGKNSWRVRYWRDDGTHGSISGFPTKKAAQDKAEEIAADQRRGTFRSTPSNLGGVADAATNDKPNNSGQPPNRS